MKREDLYMRSFGELDEFNSFIRALGGNPVAINRAAGMQVSQPASSIDFVSFAKVCAVFEQAAAQTNDPDFGLRWTYHLPEDFRFSGPNVVLMTMAKNARQWVKMVIDYQKIHTNGISFQMEEDAAANRVTGVIAVHPLAPPCRQMLEHVMASAALFARQFIPDLKLNLVTFQHGVPTDMSLYEETFRCPIVFNADRNTIVADHHYIELKKTTVLTKALSPLVKKYLNWQLEKHPKAKQTMSMVVAETIPLILGVNGSDVQHLCQALDIHPKKLQRLLKDEGTSYSDILDEVRKNVAARLLGESDISIIRLAKMLDYSSDRPLATATKRWFGVSPTKYRQMLRL